MKDRMPNPRLERTRWLVALIRTCVGRAAQALGGFADWEIC